MTRPTVSASAEHFNALLGPLNARDSDANGWAGLALATGAAAMLQGLDVVSQDTTTHVAWGIILDPDTAPAAWLPWLAELYGVQLITGSSEAEQRALIKDLPPQQRGRPVSLAIAVEKTLTGTKTVLIGERDGSAYRITVGTRTSETPDTAATIAAAVSQKAAGLLMNVVEVAGTFTWLDVYGAGTVERDAHDLPYFEPTYPAWDSVTDTFATWGDLIAATP